MGHARGCGLKPRSESRGVTDLDNYMDPPFPGACSCRGRKFANSPHSSRCVDRKGKKVLTATAKAVNVSRSILSHCSRRSGEGQQDQAALQGLPLQHTQEQVEVPHQSHSGAMCECHNLQSLAQSQQHYVSQYPSWLPPAHTQSSPIPAINHPRQQSSEVGPLDIFKSVGTPDFSNTPDARLSAGPPDVVKSADSPVVVKLADPPDVLKPPGLPRGRRRYYLPLPMPGRLRQPPMKIRHGNAGNLW
ncbi:unnamed protein product [Leuciscus chuanchicus]